MKTCRFCANAQECIDRLFEGNDLFEIDDKHAEKCIGFERVCVNEEELKRLIYVRREIK